MVDKIVFFVAALACLSGALGLILARNPVHAALSLVGTLFGIAIHFVNLGAHFLAAVQVVVYAGAIVVLFLFVIMLLGVDRLDELDREPLIGQRPAAAFIAIISTALLTLVTVRGVQVTHGAAVAADAADKDRSNIELLGRALFTDYVFAFEVTSVLLVIAVVGAVVLSRRGPRLETSADVEA